MYEHTEARDLYPEVTLEGTSVTIPQEVSLDDLVYYFTRGDQSLSQNAMYSLVVGLDLAACDWELTKRLHSYFSREMEVYVNEVCEDEQDAENVTVAERPEAVPGPTVNLNDEATYEAIRETLNGWVGETTRNAGNGKEYPVDHHQLTYLVIEALQDSVADYHQPALFDSSELYR